MARSISGRGRELTEERMEDIDNTLSNEELDRYISDVAMKHGISEEEVRASLGSPAMATFDEMPEQITRK